MIELKNAAGRVTISPYGGQVMSYRPANARDVLWQTTPEFLGAAEAAGQALRGGIPVCWPWFGRREGLPPHGFVRTAMWQTESLRDERAVLSCATDGQEPGFPHQATVRLTVTLSDTLEVVLTTINTGSEVFTFTQALHPYFNVGDISQTFAHGLDPKPVTIRGEVDRLYTNVSGPFRIEDRALRRVIHVVNSSTESQLWNPWAEKASKLDMPPDGYRRMLCLEAVETAVPVILKPGESRSLSTRLWVES